MTDDIASFRRQIKTLGDEQLIDLFATMVLVLTAHGGDAAQDDRVKEIRTAMLARMDLEKLIR